MAGAAGRAMRRGSPGHRKPGGTTLSPQPPPKRPRGDSGDGDRSRRRAQPRAWDRSDPAGPPLPDADAPSGSDEGPQFLPSYLQAPGQAPATPRREAPRERRRPDDPGRGDQWARDGQEVPAQDRGWPHDLADQPDGDDVRGGSPSHDRDPYGGASNDRDPYDRDPYAGDSYGRDSYDRAPYGGQSYARDANGPDDPYGGSVGGHRGRGPAAPVPPAAPAPGPGEPGHWASPPPALRPYDPGPHARGGDDDPRGATASGLPQRAPGQALGGSSLSRGGRSTGDPRYTTGSNPVLPPLDRPPAGPPTGEPWYGGGSGTYGHDGGGVPQALAYAPAGPGTIPGVPGGPGVDVPDAPGLPGHGRPYGSPYEPDDGGFGAGSPSGPGFGGPDDDRADGDDRAESAGTGRRGRRRRGARGPAFERGPKLPTPLDEAPRLPYVPALEGLRALALVAILAFHQGFDLARGGFLGISSFFTLSGFLLGTLVLAEWAQTGRLGLGRLWERRARRIVPAYVVTIAVVVVLQFAVRVGIGERFRGDVLWALGFAGNWRNVVSDQDASALFISASPVQHLWSVALLVQLLVVVPLLFVGLMRLAGRRWRLTGAAFALLAVASFGLAHLASRSGGNGGIAYFGTHTRAGELLVGIALAYGVLSPHLRGLLESAPGQAAVRWGAPAALAGLAVLWTTTSLGDPRLFGGLTALNAVLTAWVVLALTATGPAATALGSWPLRQLGRISFGAYLLHWPIYLLLDEPRVSFDGPVLFAARIAATLAAAVALHLAVERPWRRGMRMPRRSVAAVLVLATAVVVVATLVLPQQPPPNVSLTIGDGSGAGELDVVVPSGGTEAASIALVGDRLAGSLPSGFASWNGEHPDEQVRLSTHVADDCPPGAPGPVRLAGETIGDDTTCTGWEPRLPRLLDAAAPDSVVVLTGLGELGEREIDGTWHHLGDPVYDDWLSGELDALASTLADGGAPVLWPTVPHVRLPGADGDWTAYDDNDPRRVDRYNELVREAAEGHDAIRVLDLTAWAQELPRGGEFSPDYRQDGATFTEAGADTVADWFAAAVIRTLDAESSDDGDEGGDAG